MLKQLFVLLLIFSASVNAQTTIISGYVRDAKTMQPLPGANVIAGNSIGAATDTSGYYEIRNMYEGELQLTVSYIGYIAEERNISTLELNRADFLLQPDEGFLSTVVVTGSKYEKNIGEETVTIDVIKPSLIEHTSPVTIDETIDKVPGVNVIDDDNIRIVR